MNDIGRTLLSGLAQTICYVHGLNRREITLSQIGFFAELRDKHDVDDASFLVDGAAPLQRAVANTVSISDTNDMEIGTASNISIARQKIELLVSQTVSATPKQQQQTSGSDPLPSHAISVSEHDPAHAPNSQYLPPHTSQWAVLG